MMVRSQGYPDNHPPGHPPDREQMVGVAVLAVVEFRHAAEAVWQHFSDCHTATAVLRRAAELDETTFAGVVTFGLLLVVFVRPQARMLVAAVMRRVRKWGRAIKRTP